jgi:diguanylate cyclase (GGDEF)-like protein
LALDSEAKMVRIKSIREKLIIGIFLGCFIPYLIGGIYLDRYTEHWLYEDELTHLSNLISQVAFMVDESFIKSMEQTTALLAGDERLRAHSGDIRDYLLYDADAKDFATVSKGEAGIETVFSNVKATHEAINFIFYGTDTGAYMETPEFAPSSKYDPRVRPWYINAISSNDVLISEPYITKFTQQLIISFTKKVMDESERVGVVGIGVKLDTVADNVAGIDVGKSGILIVLNNHNTIIICPEHPEWRLKSLSELGIDMLSEIDYNANTAIEGKIDGVDKIVQSHQSSYSGWRYIVIVDKAEIVSEAKHMTNVLILVYTLALFLIFIFVYQFSNRITTPILEITESLNDLALFKFDAGNAAAVKKYQKQGDEIGIIANAMLSMRDNYSELSNNIKGLDEELKLIDITKTTSYQLTLSEKNPFNNFTVSVNKLLERVHTYLNELKATEEELIAQLEEIDSQKEYINYLAFHDPLTNLPNRRKFIEMLEWALQEHKNGAVILLDLDNFKSINDTLGHVFGDKVLQSISEKLQALADQNVFISRFGGDEFLLLCIDAFSTTDIKNLTKRMIAIFSERFLIEEHEIDVNFSMGISRFPEDSTDVNQLIMNADLALYSVKNRGKNGYAFFKNTMTEHLISRANVEVALREALAEEAFYIVYQPQVDIHTGDVLAYEALVRMASGDYMPDQFIPIAEENGMIIRIGRLVTRMVIEQVAKWKALGYPVKPVAINFSVVQIHDSSYADYLNSLLEMYGIPASLIEIEITENVFIDNREASLVFMEKLKRMGIKISIDDFGTGYSSLSYLTFLPIDKIKLDRSLNLKFLEIENIKVMDSLIQLAHSLNLVVIAEGIEIYEHVRRLKIGVCDGVQGYYFSRPLTVEEVEERFDHKYYNEISNI